MELLFVCLAAHDSEFRRWPDGVDRRICQTFAASPAEPGELLLGFRGPSGKSSTYQLVPAVHKYKGLWFPARCPPYWGEACVAPDEPMIIRARLRSHRFQPSFRGRR